MSNDFEDQPEEGAAYLLPAPQVNKAQEEEFDNDENTLRADLRVWVHSPDEMSEDEIVSAILKAVYGINQRVSTVITKWQASPPDAGKEQEAVDDKFQFAEWCELNYWGDGKGLWSENIAEDDVEQFTTQQIYTLYKQQNK